MKKQSSTKKKIAGLSVAAIILAAIFAFLVFWFFGAKHPEFRKLARAEADIPCLDDGISPQGLCFLPDGGEYTYCMSGYMVDGSPSRLCFFGGENTKYITLKDGDSDVTTHFGGVTSTGQYLIVASGNDLVRVSIQTALAAENGAAVAIEGKFTVEDMGVAFCYYGEGKLYAGEFYRAGNYETPEEHRHELNGEMNYAFIYEYDVNDGADNWLSETPNRAISVGGLVQGVAVTEDRIYLSTSYGLPDSTLWAHKNVLGGQAQGTVSVRGADIPLYRLDSTTLETSLTMPCMSEEICVKDGRIHILFESLCKKYRYVVRTRIGSVYSIALSDLL